MRYIILKESWHCRTLSILQIPEQLHCAKGCFGIINSFLYLPHRIYRIVYFQKLWMYKLYMQVFCFFRVKQQSSFYDSTPEVSLVFCLEHTFLSGSPCHIVISWSISHSWNSLRNRTWAVPHQHNFSPAALPGQFAYALGKLLGGPMVDSLGGTNSLLAILLFLDLFLDRNGFCHEPRRLASQPFLFLPIRSWLPWQIFSRLVF